MKRHLLFPALSLTLVCISFASISLGRYHVAVGDIFSFIGSGIFHGEGLSYEKQELMHNLLINIRLPRVLAALLIGASLSVSGAAFQSMFVNPLVSPGLLGVLAGSSFGASFGMVFSKSWLAVQGFSLVFGFLAVIIAVGIARIHRGNTMLLLILGGVISGSLFTALLSIIKYLADPYNQLPAITQWLMGGLTLINMGTLKLVSIPLVGGIIAITLLSGYLNAMSMGDEEARSLGIPVEKMRMLLIFLSTMISAITVVMAGMIGWVGLIIPHISRMIVGPDNKRLIPACGLIGAIYLILVDDLSRIVLNVEVPIGITTSLIGIPFFIVILKNARKGWN